jgi:hypothetical protein
MPRSCGNPGGAPPSTSAHSTLSAAKAASSSPARCSSASARQNDARCSSVPSRSTSMMRLYPPCEAAVEARRQQAWPAMATMLPSRLQLRCLEGRELGVVCLRRAGPPLRDFDRGLLGPGTEASVSPVTSAVPGSRSLLTTAWRKRQRNSPWPITVEKAAGGGRAAAGRSTSCSFARPDRKSTCPA